MSAFSNVVGAELVKLRQRPLVIATAALLVGAKALSLILAHHSRPVLAVEELAVNGFYVVAEGARFALVPFALLLFVAAAQSVAGEQERGQLRMTLVRPVSRKAFFGGRVAAFAIAALVVALADLVLGLACGLPLGFSDVADVALQGPEYGAAALFGRVLLAYGLGAIALAAVAAVGLCVSACASQATTAVSAGFVFALVLVALWLVFGDPALRFLLSDYVSHEFEELVKRTTGVSVYREPGSTLRGVLVPLVWLSGATVLGWSVFERKEIRG